MFLLTSFLKLFVLIKIGLKSDVEDLLVVCDLDHHVVENDVKEKLFLDLLHMGKFCTAISDLISLII